MTSLKFCHCGFRVVIRILKVDVKIHTNRVHIGGGYFFFQIPKEGSWRDALSHFFFPRNAANSTFKSFRFSGTPCIFRKRCIHYGLGNSLQDKKFG